MLCEDLPYPTEAVQIAERLQAALRPRLTIAGTDSTVTASIGIAFAPRIPVEPDELLHNADLAMYRAKARGRARYNVYGAEPVNSTTEWLRLVAELRRALDECELVVHYQPRVDLRTLHIVGAEALLRWQHPTRGLLPPGAFLDTAERSGLLDAICEHVLRTACTDAAGWPALEGSQLLISVNVSARQLADNGIVAAVTRALTDSGLDPRRLVLELTETTVIDDVEAALRVFGDLEALGVQVSIDDFGTGSSSLAHLRWLHVDEIKIDHSFSGFAATGSGGATGAGGSDQTAVDDTAILTSIIDLAHTLAIRAVADGVETPTQHATLLTLGCDHAQGHHYHHPVPADQLLDLIRADRPPRLPDS